MRMATKADFTSEEWEALQKGITGAGMLVATSDRGFFDTFKEAKALAKHLTEARTKSESALVRDLATAHGSPFGMTASPAEIEQGTRETLTAGVAALEAKAPDELPAYRRLVLDVAESVAEAAGGVAPSENKALETVRTALGST
jgi:tellurite resistance protein